MMSDNPPVAPNDERFRNSVDIVQLSYFVAGVEENGELQMVLLDIWPHAATVGILTHSEDNEVTVTFKLFVK